MKKVTIITGLVFASILIAPPADAQGLLHPEWMLKYSSTVANGDAEAWDVAGDGRGHLYWATSQFRPGFANYFDVMIYKLDTAGNELWPGPAIYGAANNQQAYVCGLSNQRLFVGGRDCRADEGDIFLLAVDTADGDTLWSVRWDQSAGYDEADGIMIGNEGILVTGWTTGAATRQDVVVMKVDSGGTVQWAAPWGSVWGEHADGHAVMDSSAVYLCGLFGGSGIFNNFDGLSLLAKFRRADGALLDSVTFGRTDSWPNMENALGMTTDGTFLYVTGITTPALNDWDIYLAKYDKNLNRIWYTIWRTDSVESARAVALDNDGNIYVAGSSKGVGQGNIDVVLLKFRPDSSLAAWRIWGDTLDDQVLNILIDGGYLYLTGLTKSFNPGGRKEAILMKIDLDSLTSLREMKVEALAEFTGVKPNPVRQIATVSFRLSRASEISLKLYDALGRPVATTVSEHLDAGSYSYAIDTARLPAGIYFCFLQSGLSLRRAKIIVTE